MLKKHKYEVQFYFKVLTDEGIEEHCDYSICENMELPMEEFVFNTLIIANARDFMLESNDALMKDGYVDKEFHEKYAYYIENAKIEIIEKEEYIEYINEYKKEFGSDIMTIEKSKDGIGFNINGSINDVDNIKKNGKLN